MLLWAAGHTAVSSAAAALARLAFFNFDGASSKPAARPAVVAVDIDLMGCAVDL